MKCHSLTFDCSSTMLLILSQLGPITRRFMRRLSVADVVAPKIWLKLFPVQGVRSIASMRNAGKGGRKPERLAGRLIDDEQMTFKKSDSPRTIPSLSKGYRLRTGFMRNCPMLCFVLSAPISFLTSCIVTGSSVSRP